MAKKKEPLIVPAVFSPNGEANRYLERFKNTRLHKWSITRADSLWEIGDLAAYLASLGRLEEAAGVGAFVSKNVAFQGNYNIWSPASSAISHASYALRKLGDHKRAQEVYHPVWQNQPCIYSNPGFFRSNWSDSQRRMTDCKGVRSVDARLGALTALRYYIGNLEAKVWDVPGAEWFPVERLEQNIEEAFELLRFNIS